MAAVNLRHIEIFHAVMTAGSLTEAAHLLHTSQPTVSRELARFEKVIGLKLFERVRGRLHPTVQDCVCLKRCNDHGTDWIALSAPQKVCASFARRTVYCLPAGLFAIFLPQLLQPFLVRYPDVSLNIVPQNHRYLKSGSRPSVMI